MIIIKFITCPLFRIYKTIICLLPPVKISRGNNSIIKDRRLASILNRLIRFVTILINWTNLVKNIRRGI